MNSWCFLAHSAKKIGKIGVGWLSVLTRSLMFTMAYHHLTLTIFWMLLIKICSNFYERFSVLSTIHLFCTLNSIFLRSEMHYDALYVMSNVWLIPQCVCPSTTSAVRQILPTVCKIQFQRKGRKFRLTFSDSYLITVT